jgi:hypothetical protein
MESEIGMCPMTSHMRVRWHHCSRGGDLPRDNQLAGRLVTQRAARSEEEKDCSRVSDVGGTSVDRARQYSVDGSDLP